MREATRNLFGLFEIFESWKLEHPTAETQGLNLDAKPQS